MASKAAQPKFVDLVLSGGGVKFIGLVGAIVALMDAGYSIKRVSGVSAGSVVAAILAAGSSAGQLTGAQVKELAFSVPLHKWRDAGGVPYLGAAWGLVTGTSLYRGDVAHDWIRSELKNFGICYFGDLRLDGDHLLEGRRSKLVVTVADVTAAQLVRFPWDYRRLYGLDPDEQPVADAVRASMAIPFFYRPVKLTAADGTTSTLVDGRALEFPHRHVRPPRRQGAALAHVRDHGAAEAHRGSRCGDAGPETLALARADGIAGKPAHHHAGRPRPNPSEPAVGCGARHRGRIDRCRRARLRHPPGPSRTAL